MRASFAGARIVSFDKINYASIKLFWLLLASYYIKLLNEIEPA